MKSKHVVTSIQGSDKKLSPLRVALPQLLAVSAKNLVLLAFGMTIGYPTILIPNLSSSNSANTFSLSQEQISWIGSIMLICVPMGCILSGPITQPIGRKRAMQLVNFPFIAQWLLFKYSSEVWHLYLALAICGFTGGLLEAPVLTYVAEITQPHLRGMLSATSSLSINLGILIQFLIGTFLHWRTVALVCCIVPAFALISLFLIPESPHWLVMNHRHSDAQKSLAWLRGWTTIENVEAEFKEICKNGGKNQESVDEQNNSSNFLITKVKAVFKLFSQKSFLWPFALISFVFFLQHFCGITSLQTYAVHIFATLRAPIDKFYATIVLGVVEFLGCLTCVILIRFAGKRKLTFVSTLSAAFCFFVAATYAYMLDVRYLILNSGSKDPQTGNETLIDNGYNVTQEEHYWLPSCFLIAAAFLTHCGIRILPWILIGEVYPREIRAAASGLSGTSGYVFGFAANKVFLQMVGAITLPGTFWFFSGISIVGTIILFFTLPETEGKSLAEITDHFDGTTKMDNKVKRKRKTTLGNINPAFEEKGLEVANDKNDQIESKL